MMKKISLVVENAFLNNKIFGLDEQLNCDDCLFFMRYFKSELLKLGYDLSTYDINSIEDSEKIFYFDINPNVKIPQTQDEINKSYLFIFECQIIAPHMYCTKLHKLFNRIFTFRDDLVDNKRYFKINYCFNFPPETDQTIFTKKKLCALVAGNKVNNHRLELYSERVNVIKWFQKNAPDSFDFYGRGWGRYVSKNVVLRKLCNKSKIIDTVINKIFYKPWYLYRGELLSKIDKLKEYKFSICYENARDIPGYITEKIFHAFFAGCVPIYWGASNITDYIPSNCFVDKRSFLLIDDLYKYISSISDENYMHYLANISRFLKSDRAKIFANQWFSEQIISLTLFNKDSVIL